MMNSKLITFFENAESFIMENPIIWMCSFISLVLAVTIIPAVILLCKKYQWYDSVNARKIHSGNIPRLGSVGFVTAFTIATIIYICIEKDISKQFIPLVIAGFIIFLFGVIDDFKDLPARLKLLMQIIAALIIVFGGFRIKNIFSLELPKILSRFITFLWIIGITNSYNLIDGLDGLCGSLSCLVILTYGVIFSQTASCYASICIILAFAVMGFLIYNKPKAVIFMGDGGSQFLGFMIATLPLFRATPNFENNKALILLNLVAIPMIDCIAAIWRRIREHRGIMSPDKSHIHHKLMRLGFSSVQILIICLFAQLVICLITIFSMAVEQKLAWLILVITYAMVIGMFTILHFLNKRKTGQDRKKRKAHTGNYEDLNQVRLKTTNWP